MAKQNEKQEAEKTLVHKVVANIDDLEKLRKSRPRLFVILCALGLLIAAWWSYDHLYAIPHLKSKVGANQADLHATSKERDNLSAKLERFLEVAEKLYSNAPPDQRLDMLAQRLASIENATSQKLISSNTLYSGVLAVSVRRSKKTAPGRVGAWFGRLAGAVSGGPVWGANSFSWCRMLGGFAGNSRATIGRGSGPTAGPASASTLPTKTRV